MIEVCMLFVALWPQFGIGGGITNDPSLEFYDLRCNPLGTSADFDSQFVTIWKEEYNQRKVVRCQTGKNVLPDYSSKDNWVRLFELVSKLKKEGKATCDNFPQVFDRVFTALDNPVIFSNCTAVVDFCEGICGKRCPHVVPTAFSSRRDAILWGKDTLTVPVGRCSEVWIGQNIATAKEQKEVWIQDLQLGCSTCWRGTCSNNAGLAVYMDYMTELNEDEEVKDAQQIWDKICLTPAVLGYFSVRNFHLQRRYGSFEPEISIKLKIQHEWFWVAPLLIGWIFVIHIYLYAFPNHNFNIFNLWRDAELKERADRVWQFLLQRIKTKPLRFQARKERRKGRKVAKKRLGKKRRISHPPEVLKLPKGTEIGKKYGPQGRGGRKRS